MAKRKKTIKTVSSNSAENLVPTELIERSILLIRGERVILDSDLAALYGVATKRLNEQVRRNIERFPADFAFRLTQDERDKVVANCDHLEKLKFSAALPMAFTEHGALMAANVLKTPVAIEASLTVVRTFVRLRRILASNRELARKLESLEKKYDGQFKVVFDALKALMAEPKLKEKPRIGF